MCPVRAPSLRCRYTRDSDAAPVWTRALHFATDASTRDLRDEEVAGLSAPIASHDISKKPPILSPQACACATNTAEAIHTLDARATAMRIRVQPKSADVDAFKSVQLDGVISTANEEEEVHEQGPDERRALGALTVRGLVGKCRRAARRRSCSKNGFRPTSQTP